MISRRFFMAAAPAALAACGRPDNLDPKFELLPSPPALPPIPPLPARYGAITDEPYPVPAVPEGVVPQELWRQEVANPYPQYDAGTVVIDPVAARLHLIQENGRALRYGVSVGRAGYGWSGDAIIQYGRKWPRWKVPDDMLKRQPELAPYSWRKGGMKPGPGNPLGARALYLYHDGKDTLYRIHGACEPQYLGKQVSSGCIRMLDQDVIDLYDRVDHHAKVEVLTPPDKEWLAKGAAVEAAPGDLTTSGATVGNGPADGGDGFGSPTNFDRRAARLGPARRRQLGRRTAPTPDASGAARGPLCAGTASRPGGAHRRTRLRPGHRAGGGPRGLP